jgi:hypothetical protein
MANPKSDRAGYAAEFIKGDWAAARYVKDQDVDNLLSVVVSLGAEVWATRRRQMVVEALLAKNKLVSAHAIESYQPSEEERAAWASERDDTIERIYSVLQRVSHPTSGVPPKEEKAPPLKP